MRGRQSQREGVRAAPAQKDTWEALPQSVSSHIPPVLGGGISPAPFPAVSTFFSSPYLPEAFPWQVQLGPCGTQLGGRGQAQQGHGGKGLSCALCCSCRALPCSFPFFFSSLPHYFGPFDLPVYISISECWLLRL